MHAGLTFVTSSLSSNSVIIIMAPGTDTLHNIRSRLDRVELHANAFWEDDVDSTRVNESKVM